MEEWWGRTQCPADRVQEKQADKRDGTTDEECTKEARSRHLFRTAVVACT